MAWWQGNWTNRNLHQPFCTFKFRKDIMYECPHINVLSIATFKCWKWLSGSHSCVMTFVHLKVHNGWCKFSVGSVFQIFHWFSFPHHHILGLVSTFKCGYAKNIYVWWPFCGHESPMCSFTLPDIFLLLVSKTEIKYDWTELRWRELL